MKNLKASKLFSLRSVNFKTGSYAFFKKSGFSYSEMSQNTFKYQNINISFPSESNSSFRWELQVLLKVLVYMFC